MIVGIVLIHSGLDVDDNSVFPIYDYVVTKGIIGTLTRVCVPLFFLISGYLFFCNQTEFDKAAYICKIKKRSRSLLEPYLFYNALAVCLFAILGILKPDLQSGVVPPISDWNVGLIISLFWDYGNNLPMVPQFWFIRNLMVMVVFTPLLYTLLKRGRWIVVALLGGLWGGNVWEFGIPGTMGLFFFSLGAYFAINGVSPYSFVRKFRHVGYVYPLLFIMDVMTKGEAYNVYLHKFAILSGMVFWVSVIGCFLDRHESYIPNALLQASTFFIFAMHSPYNGKIVNVMLHFMPSMSTNSFVADVQYCLYYFLTASFWILILLSIFALIRKVRPKMAIFLSGGR